MTLHSAYTISLPLLNCFPLFLILFSENEFVFLTTIQAAESLSMNGRALNDRAIEVAPSSSRVRTALPPAFLSGHMIANPHSGA